MRSRGKTEKRITCLPGLTFEPIMDRCMKTDLLVICSDQHQVFGRFSGKAVLDDGRELKIEKLTGFAEKVRNKW